jgi:probable HAF family extracellular repeat protein
MKHRTRNVLRTNLLFAFCLISSAAFSQSCTFRTVPVPTQGVSNATGINDAGAIVGNFFVNARSEGFLLYRGKFTTFKFPGSDETTPHDINNHAQIVGDYLEANHVQHGFIVHSGGFTAINVPGQPRTVAVGVNDLGDVVGLSSGPAGSNGFLLHKGQFTVIRVPNSVSTEAWGINNSGEIVGRYQDTTGTVHGFRFKNGAYTTVNFPGSFATEIHKISAAGDVVGNYQTQDARFHGFSLDKGKFRTIDNPKNTEITLILGLNNRDQIVGGGSSPGQSFEGNCSNVF